MIAKWTEQEEREGEDRSREQEQRRGGENRRKKQEERTHSSYPGEGGSPERLIPSLGVETGLAGRIFVLLLFLLLFLFAWPCPCLNYRHAAGTQRPTLTP